MFYFIKKMHHFLTANSRHGTHSPFVYALADEVIYNKNLIRSNSLITDIIDSYNKKGIDKSFFFVTDFKSHGVEELETLQNSYFMIFVKNIHHSAAELIWKDLQNDSRFTVLIDLFEFGIICKRKEQPKETFKLRYPYLYY